MKMYRQIVNDKGSTVIVFEDTKDTELFIRSIDACLQNEIWRGKKVPIGSEELALLINIVECLGLKDTD